MASIKGIVVEIGGDTNGLQKALSKVNSSTSSLSKELKGINSLLKLDPSNIELLSQKQQVLKENIEQTSKKLEELKKAQELADETIANGGKISEENYRNLQREIINTENKLKSLKLESSKWTTAGRSLEEFGNKVSNISSKVDKLGTTLTTRLTLPLTALATGLIKASKDFETAFTGVEKTVDGTAEQLQTLKQGIKDLAEEIPSSTTEISAVAEAAGQLGIATDDVLDFTKVMIDLGNSTNLSADEAASALAKFANVTKMSSKDYSKLGSTIVALGNNFATTEADIVSMSTRLAATGELAGLSEADILALATAMSSVGIEAEAGGSAMSKLLKKIQLAVETDSEELKDFSQVAGMTSKEFKQAFEKDAVKALSTFISGLNDTKRNGKSAIQILDDMGLKEVRLSNTILSLANASDVLNKSVDMSKTAWKENNALTKEANKRYQTLESRLQITKNKILNVATNTGDKLTPTFGKLLDKVDELVEKFDDLSEEEIINIVKTGALVASIGPATKIIGGLGTTIGNVSKDIGIFSQAIGVLKTNTTSGIASVDSLAKSISFLASPTGIMIGLLAAGTIAVVEYDKAQQEALGNSRETKKAIDEEIKSREELINKQNEQISTGMAEITRTQELYNELKTIVDENGKIKEGYELRANYITNELSNALGIEIEKNGNIIQGYKSIQEEIDKTILKKKAELILQEQEKSYNEALKNRESAYERLTELQNNYTEALEKYNATEGYQKFQAKKAVDELAAQMQEQHELIDGYNTDIATYENNYSLMCQNTTESLTQLVNNTIIQNKRQTDDVYNGITTQIQYYSNLVDDYKRLKDEQLKKGNEYRANEYSQQEESNRKQIEQLAEQLAAITTETNINEPEIQAAWKNIGNNANAAFFNVVGKMPENLRGQLLRIAGIINTNTEIENEFEQLGKDSDKNFKEQLTKQKGTTATEDYLSGGQQGITNKKGSFLRSFLNLGYEANSNFRAGLGDGSPSKLAKQAVIDYFLGAEIGAEKQGSKTIEEMLDYGEKLHNAFSEKINESSFSNMQGKLNSNIVDSTKTIFTTPQINFNVQELDKQKLDQCFEYVNKKFGSKY